MRPIYADAVEEAIAAGATAAAQLAELTDRTPDEVIASPAADADLHKATEGVRRLYDAWTAGPLGVPKARQLVETAPLELISGDFPLPVAAGEVTDQLRALHWPLAGFTGGVTCQLAWSAQAFAAGLLYDRVSSWAVACTMLVFSW